MTNGPDPSLLENLAQLRAASEKQAEAIREEVRANEAEIIEANRQTREENERIAQELDEQAEQRRAENAGETTGNAWSVRETADRPERAFGFEDDHDFRDDSPQQHAAPVTPSPPPRHRRGPEPDMDEDEDFSKTNWLS